MSEIGTFGKYLTFEVYKSSNKTRVLTFDDFNRKVSSRTVTHDRINKKPKRQFLGPDNDSMTFTIHASAALGVKPLKLINKIEKCIRKGTTATFVVGGKKVGKYKYMITSMSESWNHVYSGGELYEADLDITMEEYV